MKREAGEHPHTCPGCGTTWMCRNDHCVDPDIIWCSRYRVCPFPKPNEDSVWHQMEILRHFAHQWHSDSHELEQWPALKLDLMAMVEKARVLVDELSRKLDFRTPTPASTASPSPH